MLAALLLVSPGCEDETNDLDGTSARGGDSFPALDVRGGEVDSEIFAGQRTLFEGNGGDGGSINVLTTGTGTITVTTAPSPLVVPLGAADFPVPTPSGLPYFDVASGQKLHVGGSYQLDWLRVQPGGHIELTANTLIVVLGNVQIAGTLRSARNASSIDAHDLTIVADGAIHITGTVDCSGWWEDDRPPLEPENFPGGNGSELFIQSNLLGGTPGIYLGPGGRILADGGPSTAQFGAGARPGRGGQVLMGGFSDVTIAGRISARGGRAYYAIDGFEGDGGEIELVSTGDIAIYNVREINGDGGDSSGSLAGRGGTIRFEALSGTVGITGFDIQSNGGVARYRNTSRGGRGGSVTVVGQTVRMSDMIVNASGGIALEPSVGPVEIAFTGGVGGDGGSIQIGGGNLGIGDDPAGVVTLDPVALYCLGGTSVLGGLAGGKGGRVVLDNQSGNTANFGFDGNVTVRGGRGAFDLRGEDGRVCMTGASLDVAAAVTGSNNFPPAICSAADRADLTASSTISCDENSENPTSIETSVPPIVGVNFFRVEITDAIRNGAGGDPATPVVTVSTKGSLEGNLHLYVGPEGAFGSLNPADYPWRDLSSGDTKSVCVDVSGGTDAFLSVLVVEQNTFVEDFTIAVSCSDSPCP